MFLTKKINTKAIHIIYGRHGMLKVFEICSPKLDEKDRSQSFSAIQSSQI